jgi:ABC-type nitrate/sulfonate/bicarbonate transport system substrate-binding protein
MMKTVLVLAVYSGLLIALVIPRVAFAQSKKVIISYPARSYSTLPIQVALMKGFFKEEGLEPVLVQMRGQVAVPALMNDETQYTLSFSPILASILQGAALKFVGIVMEKPLHYLVARPEIVTINDLRGKKVGVQRIGSTDHVVSEALIEAKGLSSKAVKIITLGFDDAVRVEFMKKGVVDATAAQPPSPMRLQQEGYRVLAGPSDLKVGSPATGVAVTETRLKENPDEVRKVLRAIVRGIRFVYDRRPESIEIMMQWLGQNRDTAETSYNAILASLSPDGATTEATMRYTIESRLRLVDAAKPVSPAQATDFMMVNEIAKRLGVPGR